MSEWGGKRVGAGRPKGSTSKVKKPTRTNRTIRAFDSEWEIIKAVVTLVKENPKATEEIKRIIAKNSV